MEVNNVPNPVGDVFEIETIEQHVQSLEAAWNALKAADDKAPWWKFWSTANINRVTQFLLLSLDDLIQIVDRELEDGANKKATVLDAIERIYDFAAREALPLFLRPFAGAVKNYIIFTLISNAIDWIVDKYRNGSWREDLQEAIDENEESEEQAGGELA